jgi:ribonuclease P protein component
VRHTFHKAERLHSKKLIRLLFEKGIIQKLYPLLFMYLPYPEGDTHQVLFSVPRKNFKKAVDRNRIRRQMREAYRINKHIITSNEEVSIPFLIGYVYIGKLKLPYQKVEEKILISLHRLSRKLTEKNF